MQSLGSDNDFENNGQNGRVADVEIWKSGSDSGQSEQCARHANVMKRSLQAGDLLRSIVCSFGNEDDGRKTIDSSFNINCTQCAEKTASQNVMQYQA